MQKVVGKKQSIMEKSLYNVKENNPVLEMEDDSVLERETFFRDLFNSNEHEIKTLSILSSKQKKSNTITAKDAITKEYAVSMFSKK